MTRVVSRDSFDSDALRGALGCFATGITTVCARLDDGTPVGITANSFTSVSLEPPLIAFCVSTSSSTWTVMQGCDHFAVSVLASGHDEVCRQMARKSVDRFAEVDWSEAPSGSPVIDGALTWFDCSVWARYPAGDHEIVLGEIEHIGIGDASHAALLFFRSQLVDMGAHTMREE